MAIRKSRRQLVMSPDFIADLYAGRTAAPSPLSPAPAPTINALMAELVAEMIDGDVPEPLNERFPLALVWADLARLAGEDVPPAVAAVLDAPAVARWLPAGDLTIADILARCPHPRA